MNIKIGDIVRYRKSCVIYGTICAPAVVLATNAVSALVSWGPENTNWEPRQALEVLCSEEMK